MKKANVKRIATRALAFILSFIIGLGINVDLTGLNDPNWGPVVQFGYGKVFADGTYSWTKKANGPSARSWATAVEINGKMYMYGGTSSSGSSLNDLWEYNPTTNIWTQKSTQTIIRSSLASCAIDGKMYILGGFNSNLQGSLFEYNPTTDTWTSKACCPVPKSFSSVAAVNGKIYVLGGNDSGRNACNYLWEYDPPSNTWRQKANGPAPVQHHAAVAINGKMYAFGGYGSYLKSQEDYDVGMDLYEYDPILDTWVQKSYFNTFLAQIRPVVINGKIYYYYGATLNEYSLVSNTWTQKLNNPVSISNQCAVAINGKMYIYNESTAELWECAINQKPSITVASPVQNTIYTEASGNNTLTLQGTVTDPDIGSRLMVKYNIDGGAMQTIAENLITNGSFSANRNTLDIPEGSHNLNVWCEDNCGEPSLTTTIPFKIDRTTPTINNCTVGSTTNSIAMSCTASDSIAGLDPSPYRYTMLDMNSTPVLATSWLTASSYTKDLLLPNRQYSVKFEARDKTGHIATLSQNIYTKAETPVMTIGNPSSYTLDISISDANPASTQYAVCVNGTKYVTQEGGLTTSPAWITLSNKRITVKGLTPSTPYDFQVKARNDAGVETSYAPTTAIRKYTLIAPPTSPTNIIATATADNISLSWDAVASALRYDVEVDGTVVNNDTSTHYIKAGLAPGTPHTFRVRGINEGGPGSWSSLVTKSTLPNAAGVPSNLNAVPLSTTVTVTWDNVAGATGYDIEVDGVLVSNGPNTNYKHTSLIPGTSHTYRVRSINAGGKSLWSNPVTVATLVDSTAVPANINAEPLKNQVTVNWDAADGATGYEIEADGVRIDNSTRTSYIHKNLQPGTDHTYRVRSKKGTVVSDWSAMTVTTTLTDVFGTPDNVIADVQDTKVNLVWDAVKDAVGYDVEIDGTMIDVGEETSFVHEGLEANSNHTYRVRARSAAETSAWSEPVAITTFMLSSPQNISGLATGSVITVTWDPVNNADTYDLEVDGSIIPDLNGTSYTCNGLMAGMQHIFRVKAKNTSGASNWSRQFTFSVLPNISTTPNVSGITRKTSIIILWKPMEGAVGYDLEVDGILLENIVGNSYTNANLLPGTSHTYKVRARYQGSMSEWSNTFTASTLSEKPAVPTNVVAAPSMTSLLVSWDKVTGAEGYEIEVDGVVIDNGTGTSYLHTGLKPDMQHSYRVRAKSVAGVSDWSTITSKKTISSVQTYELDCAAGEEINLILSAKEIQDLSAYTFTITYNGEDFEAVDLCSLTARMDLTAGAVTGTDINIVQYESGTVVFSKISSTQSYEQTSGIVNSIKLKAKKDGHLTVTYSID